MISNLKGASLIMKAEAKAINPNVLNLTDKNFNIKINPPVVFEKNIRVLKQNKEPQLNTSQDQVSKNQAGKINVQSSYLSQKEEKVQLNEFNEADQEQEKYNKVKYPFLWIEEKLFTKLKQDFPQDFNNLTNKNNTTYTFFKELDYYPIKSLWIVCNEINNLIDTYYNILSERINEFINIFCLIFDSYLTASMIKEECEIGGEKNKLSKFEIIHDSLIIFFTRCQKNKNEEMTYFFRFCFLERIFEVMNCNEYEDKLIYFCELIYKLLDPLDSQQVMFIRFIKENLISEETFYDVLGIVHDLFTTYSENFIDGCLFYVLNGLGSENIKIRYNCLHILLKYIQTNINFYLSFESNFFY